MKLSPKQVAASAAGAVAAALIASFFGEKGTIVGIALGSVVATTSTALVMQSLERTHDAMRQVVRMPEGEGLLRRLGSTRASGSVSKETEGSPVAKSAPETSGRAAGEDVAAGAGGDRRLVASTRIGGWTRSPAGPPSADGAAPVARPRDPAGPKAGERWRIRWPVVAVSAAVVFAVALLTVTGIELLVGRPLSSVVGSSQSGGGTTVGNVISPPPTTTLPPTRSTTTTSTTVGSSTTSTAAPASTTTTAVGSSASSTSTTTTTTTTTQTSGTSPSTSPGGAAGSG
jgi:hypothetical protein